MQELVSIIVPVYNVESYLKKCVDSLLSQSYENVEIILVDDGSSDSSGGICDNYGNYDNRIVVIHQQNRGIAAARNTGLRYVKGNIITFVDSDDFVSSDYVSALVSLMNLSNADISIVGFYTYCDGVIGVPLPDNSIIMTPLQAIKALASENLRCSVWGCAFKKNLFQDIKFPIFKIAEDFAIWWKLISKSKIVAYNSHPHYYYRYNPQSLMNAKISNRVMDIIPAHEEFSSFLKQNHPDILSSLNARLTRYCVAFIYRMLNEDYEEMKDIKVLQKQVKNNLGAFLKSNYSLGKKGYAVIICISIRLAKIFSKKIWRK